MSNETRENNERARRRRKVADVTLEVIDVGVGVFAFAMGIFALNATPPSILREVQWPPLVWLWALLLIVGGLGLAVGRLAGIWLAQTSGIAAASFGLAIYIVVVSSAAASELGVLVAVGGLAIALALMIRRYVDLQEFTSEWGRLSPVERWRQALKLRTTRVTR